MSVSPLYLDSLSTTPLSDGVRQAMEEQRLVFLGNPSSANASGLRARIALGESREPFRCLIHAALEEEILFTSGATESANLAIKGVAWASADSERIHIVLSEIEHPAVEESVRFLESQGFTATRVAVDPEGRVSPDSIREAIRPDTCLVAAHLGNYDSGTVQPIAEIGAVCRQLSVPLFCDASLSGGWLPINVQAMGIDLLSLAPHRFGGPSGVGVLYRRRNSVLEPLLHGGRQEFMFRAGTENVEGIVGAAVSARLASDGIALRLERCVALQRLFLARLSEEVTHWRLNGPEPGPGRDPHHLSISFQHVEAEALALRLDLRGIQVGAGTGCRSRELKLSPVLAAMGVPKEWALGTLLIGLSETLSEQEIDRAVKEIAAAVAKLREMSAGWKMM